MDRKLDKEFSNNEIILSIIISKLLTNVYLPLPYLAMNLISSSSKLLPIPIVNILDVFLLLYIILYIDFVSIT